MSLTHCRRCRKSGWPLCGPECEAKVAHNAEVVIPHQTEGTFEIEDYGKSCYLYECIAPLRALFMQKTAPAKFKKVRSYYSTAQERNVEKRTPLVVDHVPGITYGEEKRDRGVGKLSRKDYRGR